MNVAGDDQESTWSIRLGRDSDGPALIALIAACWAVYPGLRMDVDREMPELHALAAYYQGALWVAQRGHRVVGMIATRPLGEDVWETCRVYVDPTLHGSRLAHELLDTAEGHALRHGARRFVLWTDTRFQRAHAFYEKRSYIRHGGIRVLHDLSASLEFGYAKPVDGIEALDAASATSAERRLSDILIACVADGASVSFLPPLDPGKARAFYRRVSTQVAIGQRLLLAGWRRGVLVGTVALDLDTPENQPHRAEVQKLLVHPVARRSGLGREMMHQVEMHARAAGRTLLTLDTWAGSAGEALYRAASWHEAGRIPGFALDAEGNAQDTLFFWKKV
ncbi:GNAT family N-acetyltransferase [Rhodopila sp.]|uniref:GNAT family N-acetyltransferase n=1 Tax=Rhodopila sp. TaxID=2480087 RepID=UPI003D14FF72